MKNLTFATSIICLSVLFKSHLSAQCIPNFPYKDGWMGGDYAISVLLPDERTLWLFSDTFIAPIGENSRKNAVMIANTMAVSSCNEDKWNIRYDWNRKKPDEPQAIFLHNDPSHKYWPADVFISDNTLWVILSDIGPKPEATSDDLFDFKHYGTTIAKIENYGDPISDWLIEYSPWEEDFVPKEWVQGIMHEGYYYVFYSDNDRILLSRLFINDYEERLEYWSEDLSWKRGFNKTDAAVLFTDKVGGSLTYHSEKKEWILIYGPNFLSNRIMYRTATDLTGPWSDPYVLLETEENTPGTHRFKSTNFCYGAHEQNQFNHEDMIVITYDCNSSSIDSLINDLSIYHPRAIHINYPSSR
ncbi:DUF4185 domain-containing protein [Fulvivirga sedimenti]|uniref:DUF4185 domain-containing protein n=1 Tax=Fulvivirga sedimenti TaxID=2879465 RepID=A0A9X1HMU2_9BACT|nr:DUF4185 domain-containing protein [Fulvivirga sedimenti]MCA6074751.1 DUF4185 domain-containing protein [Fulvivirga sedimenti]MCA6075928.1 DUF4185 domain-containing protein [Fulvivirga sedimenti]MCA6077056.1 DUF4185 domain-containing protein [Fulvivirga sedimenti]